MLEIGKYYFCKKSLIYEQYYFIAGKYYKLIRINSYQNIYGQYKDKIGLIDDNNNYVCLLNMIKNDSLYFYNYFCDIKEERKYKLNILNIKIKNNKRLWKKK